MIKSGQFVYSSGEVNGSDLRTLKSTALTNNMPYSSTPHGIVKSNQSSSKDHVYSGTESNIRLRDLIVPEAKPFSILDDSLQPGQF